MRLAGTGTDGGATTIKRVKVKVNVRLPHLYCNSYGLLTTDY